MSDTNTPYEDIELDPAAKDKIYPELARANLLRMRGEYKGAIDQCLSILKRMPEDLDAHALIADIYSESGDLVESEQWYELALELDPQSQSLQAKLDGVRQRAQHREIAQTAEQLGLPTNGPRMAAYGSALVIVVVVIIVGAYLFGQRHPVAKHSPVQISINAPGTPDQPRSDAGDSSNPDGAQTPSPLAAATPFLPSEDRAMTVALSQNAAIGSHVMSVMMDPRTKVETINFVLRGEDEPRKIGAQVGRAALEATTDASSVTVRGVRDDKIVYMADIPRDKLADAIAGNEAQNGGPDGWIAGAVTDEWPASSAAPTPSSTPSSAPGSTPSTTTGSAAPGTTPPATVSGAGTTGTGTTGTATGSGGT